MATINYARLLSELGHHDECERVLQDGVASDFIPAYFWLAQLRYQQPRTAKERREKILPLIKYAADKGHPAAKFLFARWMVRGEFGSRYIPRGWGMVVLEAMRFAQREHVAVS